MEIYVARLSYGTPLMAKLAVRETPKMYIVEEVEGILGYTSFYVGSHLRKSGINAFETDIAAYQYLCEVTLKRKGKKLAEAEKLREQWEMLADIIEKLT